VAAREEAARAERQREEAEREAAVIRRKLEEEARVKRDEEVAKYAETKGYKLISFDDFTLDKKDLLKSGGKIALRGFYVASSGQEAFVPSFSRHASDDIITIFTEEAARDARKMFLECRKAERKGCPYMIMAKVTPCVRKTDEKQFACLTVEDAREYGKPEE
jgi:hypothetical protein